MNVIVTGAFVCECASVVGFLISYDWDLNIKLSLIIEIVNMAFGGCLHKITLFPVDFLLNEMHYLTCSICRFFNLRLQNIFLKLQCVSNNL